MSEYGSPFSTVLRSKRYAAPIIHTLLSVGAVAFIFPMFWMLSNSLMWPEQVLTLPLWSHMNEATVAALAETVVALHGHAAAIRDTVSSEKNTVVQVHGERLGGRP